MSPLGARLLRTSSQQALRRLLQQLTTRYNLVTRKCASLLHGTIWNYSARFVTTRYALLLAPKALRWPHSASNFYPCVDACAGGPATSQFAVRVLHVPPHENPPYIDTCAGALRCPLLASGSSASHHMGAVPLLTLAPEVLRCPSVGARLLQVP